MKDVQCALDNLHELTMRIDRSTNSITHIGSFLYETKKGPISYYPIFEDIIRIYGYKARTQQTFTKRDD